MRKPELLAPAGSLAVFYAAIHAGADAVYLGANSFNARMHAQNFSFDDLKNGVAYAHVRNKKVYVTLNTLVNDKEVPEFLDVAEKVLSCGVDALIVADLGMIRCLHEAFPQAEIHASTQMTIVDCHAINALKKYGVTRVVPARELPFSEIEKLVRNSGVEIEMFVHGALCVSYSGQCLMSSMIGGRSGNRGACAQPCRLPYNGKYPLSLKDLSLSNHIPEILSSGVASLKIEGRMKSAEYVYGVVKLYRKLLDEERNATQDEIRALEKLFSRSGFTDGYFCNKKEKGMTGIRTEENKEDTRNQIAVSETLPKKIPVKAILNFQQDEPISLTYICGEKRGKALGIVPEKAMQQPLKKELLYKQISKLGDTPFLLDESDFQVSGEFESLYISIKDLNQLRREAVQNLLTPPAVRRESSSKIFDAEDIGKGVAVFYKADQLKNFPSAEYQRFLMLSEIDQCQENIPDGILFPPIYFSSEKKELIPYLEKAKNLGVRAAMVQNLGQIPLASRYFTEIVGGHRLNVRNSYTKMALLKDMGLSRVILSPELILPQCRDIGGLVMAYGRIPLMLLERCFNKENFGCATCGHSSFVDRKGISFPLVRMFPHRNELLNSLPTYVGEERTNFDKNPVSPVLWFTNESGKDVQRIWKIWQEKRPFDGITRRIGVKENDR